MINILKLDGWSNNGRLKFTRKDSSLKELELFTSELHNSVERTNSMLKESKYVIRTKITGEENNYELFVKIIYYGTKSEHEHKENTHRQEIDI